MDRITAEGSGVIAITADALVNNILNAIYLASGIIAVIMIIYAGITYVVSAGDSKKIEMAKSIITYSVVGLVIIFLAFVITWFVVGRFI